MIESGLVDFWRVKYGGTTGPKGCNPASLKLEANSVSLQHLFGNFLLLLAGLLASALALAVESATNYASSKFELVQKTFTKRLTDIRKWGKLRTSSPPIQ